MAGSRRSSSSRNGAGDRTGPNANGDSRRNQMTSRANNRRNQLRKLAVAHVTNGQGGSDGGNAAVPLAVPVDTSESDHADSSTQSNKVMTNLERFLRSVAPVVPGKMMSEEANASKEAEAKILPYFFLGDLWKAFEDWSAYGAGVPFLLNETHPVTQYYVPYLSGMQVYIDSEKPPTTNGSLAEEKDVKSHEPDRQTDLVSDGSFASLNLNNQKLKQAALSNDNTEACGSHGKLAFQFIEQEGPYTRRPFFSQVSILASQFPELNNYKSCDLLPSSWICVAWYPIYRIPVGPTQEELETCFLTLHPLSTQPESTSKRPDDDNDLSPRVILPAIGMVSYKLNGSMISPRSPDEHKEERSLLMAAGNWLNNLQIFFPDYHFFMNRYSPSP